MGRGQWRSPKRTMILPLPGSPVNRPTAKAPKFPTDKRFAGDGTLGGCAYRAGAHVVQVYIHMRTGESAAGGTLNPGGLIREGVLVSPAARG